MVFLQSSDPFLSINPSRQSNLKLIRWSFELVGRPVEWLTNKLGSLIDHSSFKGGIYLFNSSAFALNRLATGQLDAYIDIAGRLVDDGDKESHLPNSSNHNQVMGLFAYDIAGAYLVAKECQCIITDSQGDSLENTSLVSNKILTCVAASNLELHQQLMTWI